jgi:hypothetical protein
VFYTLGRCLPFVFSLTFTVEAQSRRIPDRHATMNLDAIARASTLLTASPAIHRPIRVPVRVAATAKAGPTPASAPPRQTGAAIHTGFPALVDQYLSTPPDTQGAVGPNDVVSMVNSEVLIQSRGGSARSNYPVPLQQFWGSLGTFTKLFDPRLLYDGANDRWLASCGANPDAADAALLLAVSQTGDPAGAWDLFEVQIGPSGYWADYPVLGFNRDWIVLSANLLQLPPAGGYARTDLYVFDKAALYQTRKARYTTFSDSQGELAPVVDLDGSSSTFYFAQSSGDSSGGSVRIGALKGPVGAESFDAGAISIAMPASWAGTSPDGSDFAPQSGSWFKVDTGDSRLQNCVLRGGAMWCAQTIYLPADAPNRSSIQWFAADPAAGKLLQYGRLDDPSRTMFYAFPSIAVNRNNDVLIGYTRFTTADYPSAGFAFRRASDAAGVMQPGAVAKAGEAPYVGRGADESSNRWGDFSATVVDPTDGITFWTIQEYAAVPTDYYPGRWATWWAAVSIPQSPHSKSR